MTLGVGLGAPIMYTQDRKPRQPDAATVREIRAFLTACRAESVTGAATAAGAETLTPTVTVGPATGPFDLVMCAMSPASPAPMIRRVEQGPPRE
jgi:hypothetical protein